MLISFFLMMIISTSLTVPTQPWPRFHVHLSGTVTRTITVALSFVHLLEEEFKNCDTKQIVKLGRQVHTILMALGKTYFLLLEDLLENHSQ